MQDKAVACGEIWQAADPLEFPVSMEERLRGGDRKIAAAQALFHGYREFKRVRSLPDFAAGYFLVLHQRFNCRFKAVSAGPPNRTVTTLVPRIAPSRKVRRQIVLNHVLEDFRHHLRVIGVGSSSRRDKRQI